MSQGQSTQNTMNLPMRSLAAAVCVVMLGLATFMAIRGIWIGLIGELILAALMIFIKSRMTVGYQPTPDPLAAVHASPLINAPAAPLSVWDGIEVGTTSKGERLRIRLTDGSVIVAGQTRSGKTVFTNNLIAACALDPNVRMALFDGKATLEFNRYKDIAKVDRSADPAKLLAFLTELDREAERRYAVLGDLGEVKLTREIYARGDMPLYVVIVDEIGNYTITYPNKKIGQAVVHMLSSVAAKGAGAGILLVLANQRVSVEFVPGKIRANISQRIAFRVSDRIESDMALGAGSAKRGRDASTIPRGVQYRGTAFADIDGMPCVKFRADLLEYKDTLDVARRAAIVRGPVEPSSTPPLPFVDVSDVDDEDEDVLEEDVLGATRDLLVDIKTVWRRDENRLHMATILERLKELDNAYYGTYSQQLFGRRLRDTGLARYKKQLTIGDRVNWWGLEASALLAGPDGKDAKTERREREDAALDMLDEHERTLYEAKIAEIQNATACVYCHTLFDTDNPPTADHLTPLNAGGTSHAWNLVPCCRSCNSSKRDKPVNEWLATRQAS